MTNILFAGLLLGAVAGGPVTTLDHAVRLDHRSGPVDARYRGQVTVAHRQVGAVAPGGRPATLRCVWTAGLAVDREARTASGATTTRRIVHDSAIDGSRPGWCATNRAAIAREVAARMDRVHDSLQALAREDHEVLRAELDRLHGPVRTG